jgi:hypothetical protein
MRASADTQASLADVVNADAFFLPLPIGYACALSDDAGVLIYTAPQPQNQTHSLLCVRLIVP